MRQLPGGTVTLFFTDMEGSTRLLQQLGKRYADVLKECRRLLRAAFQECHGYEVDTQGDAFFVVFERALDAVLAAILAQHSLFTAHWPDGVQVKVRIGIHTGEPQPMEEGYTGLDVHRAARIMSVAHGGQVLLSQITRDLVFRELPDGVTLWYLGEHRLKDIAGRTRLFQLALPGLPDQFPQLSTIDAQQALRSLPVPATSFVGREQEIANIAQLLRQPEIRLLTLIGTAGVGKTRLALRVATQVADQFAGNLAFVPLESISEADAVLPAIAQALGIQDEGTSPLLQQIQDLLREQPFLLLLDNFEQVVSARLVIAQLLAGCSGLKLLVTSRVLLHLQTEHIYELLPLSLPASGSEDDLEKLARSAAVALFVQRAQAVVPTFRLTTSNASAVREICARLDGLPLAIELAAARLRHIPIATVLSQVVKGLAALEGTMQDLSERQRTLRGAIAWSYHLLEPAEQRVFRRLAVFASGAAMEAATHVCSVDEEAGEDIAGILMSLIDKSMVQRQESGEQETRFGLLQTLREYGREQMLAVAEWQAVRALHAAYYLAWTERLAPQLAGAQQVYWLDQLDQEYEDVQAALAWMLEENQELERIDQALRLCIALLNYWETRGYVKEGLTLLEQVLTNRAGTPSLRSQALYIAGFFALIQGENERAEYFLRECQSLFRESGDREGMANILRLQGNLAMVRNSYKVARRLLEEALAIYLERGETRKAAVARADLTQIALAQGDYARARALATENLAIYRAAGEVYAIAYPLYQLADISFRSQDDLNEARSQAEESQAYFNATGDRRFAAYVRNLLAQILLQTGESEQEKKIQAMLEENLALFKAMGNRSGIVETLLVLAYLALQQGEHESALNFYRECWKLLRDLGVRELAAMCLEGAAIIAIAQQAPERAVTFWGTAAAIRAAIVAPLPPVYREAYRAALAQARASLDEETFRACWSQGSQTPWEQIDLLP